MVCADTSFLVALERRDVKALEKLDKLGDRGETVFVTTITVAEFYRGAYGSKHRDPALAEARSLLGLFAVLDLDHDSGRLWGELSAAMKSASIGDRDLFIASIAITNRQGIITGNTKHFERVSGLVVESW